MNKLIVSEFEDGLVELRLNRPIKHNAIDYGIMDEIKRYLQLLKAKKNLRALILTGEGDKAFCSGGDVKAFQHLKTRDEAYFMLSKMGDVLYELMTFPLPTFALINGIALGGGCEIATACDIRIARKGATLGFIQGQLSITTGWGGATLLYEKLSYEQAISFLYSAKKMSANDAEHMGFIQKTVSDENYKELGYSFIKESLVNDPNVLRAYKAVKVSQWEQSNLYSRMMSEINRCAELWSSEEHHQAVSAFLTRKEKS
ncbi:enoyl-CoA hydratase/isomerase family protein [Metabacillus litoralis]|uniref:enoyl-CoA hydratase/isomerase family protein n=1 Tax=Metabacillus litoralis TaxID=152268 RepID=UPI00203F8AB5|nr:enoyl-CoA hydratase/isomerase family protein [Metabacillus litoralis]MCM3408970.1 enoyl-CoA hydratase/isomerase family protein [Metabacillus litoralis]